MTVKYISSVLFVKDIPASRRFYEELLGQQVDMDLGANVGYVGGLAIWEIGSASEMIFHRQAQGVERLGHDNFEAYFETEELDAIAERLSAAGVTIVHPIYEQPWGQRALRVYDPDCHIVEISEPMHFVVKRFAAQGLSTEQIQQRTMMPQPVIDLILAG